VREAGPVRPGLQSQRRHTSDRPDARYRALPFTNRWSKIILFDLATIILMRHVKKTESSVVTMVVVVLVAIVVVVVVQ
jgi:hypothetical protein